MKDVLITPRLCRAGRALADWQQADLAAYAGLSITAVKAFEAGSPKTRAKTRERLQRAFENNGVEFPVAGGVRAVDDVTTITRFTGADFMFKWNEDIYQACATIKGDMLTSSAGEKLWQSPLVYKANKMFTDWIEKSRQPIKSLIPEDQKTYLLPRKAYRVLPPEMLGKITYCIYADRIAFVLWKKNQIIVIRNALIVETFRSQFAYLWKLGKSISL